MNRIKNINRFRPLIQNGTLFQIDSVVTARAYIDEDSVTGLYP